MIYNKRIILIKRELKRLYCEAINDLEYYKLLEITF